MLYNDSSNFKNKRKSFGFYLNKIDYFSEYISFNYNESRRIHSFFGVSLTILLCVLTITMTFVIGQDLYLKNEPSITESQNFNSNSELELGANRGLMFAFRNNAGNLIEKDYFTKLKSSGVLSTIVDSNVEEQNEYSLMMASCDNTEFDFITKYSPGDIITQKSFCIKTHNIYPRIKNPYRYFNSALFTVYLSICENMNSSDCSTLRNMVKSIDVYYVDTYLDPFDYSNPIKYFLNNSIVDVSVKFGTDIYFSIKNSIFESDNGWIFSTNNSKAFFEINIANKITTTTSYYIGINFSVSQTSSQYKRQYLKIQDIIASVGGFVNGFIIVCKVLFIDYFEFLYLMKVNKLIIKENKKLVQNFIHNKNSNRLDQANQNMLINNNPNHDSSINNAQNNLEKFHTTNQDHNNFKQIFTNEKFKSTLNQDINANNLNNINSSNIPLQKLIKNNYVNNFNNLNNKNSNNIKDLRQVEDNLNQPKLQEDSVDKNNKLIKNLKTNDMKIYSNKIQDNDSFISSLQESESVVTEPNFLEYLKYRLSIILCLCKSDNKNDHINNEKEFVFDFLSVEKEIMSKLKHHYI